MKIEDLTVPMSGDDKLDADLRHFNDLARELSEVAADIDLDECKDANAPSLNEKTQDFLSNYETLKSKREELLKIIMRAKDEVDAKSHEREIGADEQELHWGDQLR